MPELPEVETVRRQLQNSLINKRIKEVFVYMDKMVKVGVGRISNVKKGSKASSVQFAAALVGKKILAVDRRAKYLLIKLSGGYNLMIHLRMSGQLIFIPRRELKNSLVLSLAKTAIAQVLPTKHTHVEFVFSSGSKLFYNDTRQFGHIRLVSDLELQQVLDELQLGPEPLSLSLKDFEKLISVHSDKRAKDFLLNQNIIAGIGNIYADEALFMARIHPETKMRALLGSKRWNHGLSSKRGPGVSPGLLLRSIKKVLSRAIKLGGSSIEYFLMTNGSAGKFSEEHLVYGKAGKPCPNCSRPLKSKKIGSRTTVFCSHCQDQI